jgi:hypothetical protein
VEIFVNGKKVATLAFDLTVHGRRRRGLGRGPRRQAVGLRGGDVGIKATLAMAGRTLAEREAPFPLGVSVPLGRGFPLLPGRRTGRSTPRRLRSLMIGAAVVLLAALVSIGVVAVGAFGSTPERAQPPAQISGAVKQGETRNVRAGPSNGARVIATVRSGDPLVVRCTTASGWMRLVPAPGRVRLPQRSHARRRAADLRVIGDADHRQLREAGLPLRRLPPRPHATLRGCSPCG